MSVKNIGKALLMLLGISGIATTSLAADSVVVLNCNTCETVANFKREVVLHAQSTKVAGNYIAINHMSGKAAEFMVHFVATRGGTFPQAVDGETDSELGERYGVITLNAKTLPPLRLPENRLIDAPDQDYTVDDRNHPDMSRLIRKWMLLQVPAYAHGSLRGKRVTVFFTDGYSGQYMIVEPTFTDCCMYIPGTLRDPQGRPIDESKQLLGQTSSGSLGVSSVGIDGGRRELSITGVGFTYNVPGSRIARRGIVHISDLDYHTTQRRARMQ